MNQNNAANRIASVLDVEVIRKHLEISIKLVFEVVDAIDCVPTETISFVGTASMLSVLA
jgi:hypothetical protein